MIAHLVAQLTLAADPSELFEGARDELLHGDSGPATVALLVAFGALVGLIILLPRMFRSPESITPPPRIDMLRVAAEVLKLSHAERRDLALLAHRSRHPQPAAMLLTPANLSSALATAHSAYPDQRLAQHISELCVKLHGAPLPKAS